MKKLLVLAGLSAFLLLSCSTNVGIVYDDSIPVEQTAWISRLGRMGPIGVITGYNGIAVNWKNQGWYKLVQIPAGDTLLEWDIDATILVPQSYHDKAPGTNYTYQGKNMVFRYTFKPQKTYYFTIELTEDDKLGVRIHEYNFGEKLSNLEDHFVDFVPFLNVKSNTEKTVLD